MIVKFKKSFKVADIQMDDDIAIVTCRINPELRDYVQVGESITTEDHFDINFGGFTSKWKIIFYPKGQYDFGIASNDCRIYIRLISCEQAEVKMKIRTYLISSQSSQSSTVRSTSSNEYLFVANDNLRNWAGPFSMQLIVDDNNSIECLSIKCMLKLISNVKDSKRGLSETDTSPKDNQLLNLNSSKKSRSVSPCVGDMGSKQIFSPMEVDVALKDPPKPSCAKSTLLSSPADASFRELPDPFTTKSPLLYAQLTQYRISSENRAYKFVNSRRGDFRFREPSSRRTLIYTPDERDEIRKLPHSCGTSEELNKMSLNQSNVSSEQNNRSKQFKSSGCLEQSKIEVGVDKTDKNNEQSDAEETSTSDAVVTLSSHDESNEQATFKEKVRFFQRNSK